MNRTSLLQRSLSRSLPATLLITAAAGAGISVPGGAPLAFSDYTAASGISAQNIPAGPLLFSVFSVAPMIGGAAVADYNRDGYQDIFFVAGGGTRDRLFINNNGNGTFSEQAIAWGVGHTHMGLGASSGDYNKDGWPDIFVTSVGSADLPAGGQHRLYRNNGNGTFTNVAAAAGVATASPGADGFGSTWGDYDLDGDLDLLVLGWVGNSGGNCLFRNNGDGTFTNVTAAAGFNALSMRGFSPALVDMNGDRYPEIVCTGDFGTSQYFINNTNGTFTKWTQQAGLGLDGNGMGSAIGDFNRDGRLDWYVTSVHSYYHQSPGIPGTGNMLYWGQGNHTFSEGSIGAGVNDGGWGWGTAAIDLNHDGLEDIVETNGWPFSNDLGDPEWMNEHAFLWRNNGDLTFTEVHASAGLAHTLQGRGLAHLDIENDGDQDVIIIAYFDQFRIYRNELQQDNQTRWLRLFFDTSLNPTLAADGIGSVVRVSAGGVTQVRAVHTMCHYLSTGETSAHFGLGTEADADEVRIEWPNGVVTVLTGVAANQTLTITAPPPGDATGDGFVHLDDVAVVINHWGQATWQGDVTGDGVVTLADLALMILNWDDK